MKVWWHAIDILFFSDFLWKIVQMRSRHLILTRGRKNNHFSVTKFSHTFPFPLQKLLLSNLGNTLLHNTYWTIFSTPLWYFCDAITIIINVLFFYKCFVLVILFIHIRLYLLCMFWSQRNINYGRIENDVNAVDWRGKKWFRMCTQRSKTYNH